MATPGGGAACGWFGFALNTAATFDVFCRLQVTNYGLFNILFESTPNGSDHVNVWLSCILAQTASPNLFRGNLLATNPSESKRKNCLRAYIQGTLGRRAKIQDFSCFETLSLPSHSIAAALAALPCMSLNPFVPFLSDHLPLELMPVRLGPGQFEFEMRFRSVRVQRLPRFAIDRHAAEVPFL